MGIYALKLIPELISNPATTAAMVPGRPCPALLTIAVMVMTVVVRR